MILGMPCIATFAGGTGSLLRDGVERILIQEGDPWSMAGAIMEMIHNYSQAIAFGKNARVTALKRHHREKTVDELINTYRTILNR